jgi:hypothetical protein
MPPTNPIKPTFDQDYKNLLIQFSKIITNIKNTKIIQQCHTWITSFHRCQPNEYGIRNELMKEMIKQLQTRNTSSLTGYLADQTNTSKPLTAYKGEQDKSILDELKNCYALLNYATTKNQETEDEILCCQRHRSHQSPEISTSNETLNKQSTPKKRRSLSDKVQDLQAIITMYESLLLQEVPMLLEKFAFIKGEQDLLEIIKNHRMIPHSQNQQIHQKLEAFDQIFKHHLLNIVVNSSKHFQQLSFMDSATQTDRTFDGTKVLRKKFGKVLATVRNNYEEQIGDLKMKQCMQQKAIEVNKAIKMCESALLCDKLMKKCDL